MGVVHVLTLHSSCLFIRVAIAIVVYLTANLYPVYQVCLHHCLFLRIICYILKWVSLSDYKLVSNKEFCPSVSFGVYLTQMLNLL